MDRPPLHVIIRSQVRECGRWLTLEWRMHAGVAIGGGIAVFLWSFYRRSGGAFSRWGAVMTLISLVMMARRFLRGTDDTYLRDTGEADRQPFHFWHPWTSKTDAAARDSAAMRWGLGIGVVGTLIWGFGDLIVTHLVSSPR
eukprot:TRINITY_DN75253_c0_g1_i1.p1 TRINITY_DN75253_c0_g1~~TRINITY_DN75253_c0_g1_i1.p1  ORF type:complete len:141 (+),score=5.40 TRINITY_DN75253_c0_g1_i1:123-545(+)